MKMYHLQGSGPFLTSLLVFSIVVPAQSSSALSFPHATAAIDAFTAYQDRSSVLTVDHFVRLRRKAWGDFYTNGK